MKVTDEQITAAAKWLAENVMYYDWDDLGQAKGTRACDVGGRPWKVGGHYEARQEDYKDAVRSILAAAGVAMHGASDADRLWLIDGHDGATGGFVRGFAMAPSSQEAKRRYEEEFPLIEVSYVIPACGEEECT